MRVDRSGVRKRPEFMWVASVFVGLYAYCLYGLAQAAQFFRHEGLVSDAGAGLYASAFAVGLVAAGLWNGRTRAGLSPMSVAWGAGVGMAVASLAMASAPGSAVSYGAALVMGASGGILLTLVNASLVATFGVEAAGAIAEANVAASLSSLAGPVIVWALSAAGLGWRPLLLVPIVVVGAGWIGGRHLRLPDTGRAAAKDVSLPPRFWAHWVLVVLAIAIEFSLVFWTPALVAERVVLAPADANGFLALLVAGMLAGRIAARRASDVAVLRPRIWPSALASVVLGSVVMWLAVAPVPMAFGVVLAGAGAGVLYPEAVAAAIRLAPGHEATASARCSFGFGLALLVAPVLLGFASGLIGLWSAFTLVFIEEGAAVAVLVALRRSRPPGTRPANPPAGPDSP